MPKELVISATPHETRVAILEDGQLCEIYVEREKEFALVGSIYKGRVTRVLPGMQSAFVDIGLDSDAFLYVSDFLEDIEEYDQIVTTVEGKVQRMEQQGGQVFGPPAAGQTAMLEPPEVTGSAAEPARQAGPSTTPGGEAGPTPPGPSAQPRGYEPRGRVRGGRGRWGRRNGRGSNRRQGRDFPPSKYASPRPYEPPPASYEPVILPGESLAKYRDRIPVVPASEPAQGTDLTQAVEPAPRLEESRVESPGIPAISESAPAGPQEKTLAGATPETETKFSTPEPYAAEPMLDMEAFAPATPTEEVPQAAPGETRQSAPLPREEQAPAGTVEAELTAEEASTLAEQLAEARQEEAEAEAEQSEISEEIEIERAALVAEVSEAPETGPVHELPEGSAQPSAKLGPTPESGAFSPLETPPAPEPLPFVARVQENSRAHFQRPMRRGGRRQVEHHGRPHERHPAPRRTQLISEMLKPGQEIIVQIAKEPLGKKGARITSHVALPGRLLVYMPTVDHIGVSRKISSSEERARLRRLLLELKGTLTGGFIVRTASEGATEEELRLDVEFLGKTWNDIRARAEQRRAPAILHRDLNLVERILRDHLSLDYAAIWIDNEEEFTKIVEFVGRFHPQMVSRVKLYTKEAPIFEEFGIQPEIDKSLRPKVWLKSGGYIVINHTEALVAIDVNTGKFVGRGSTRLEDTIVKNNLEAVKEIVRQIRLRDLGGIIVIDFIDMEERRNRDKVMQALEDALRSDRAPSKALGFNEFGLVAITRKRTKQALERVLCQPCPYCTGSGMVKSIPTICYEIQAEARKMAREVDSQSLTLRVHPEVAKALKTRESALIDELEHWTRKSVIIQADPTLHWEQYDIY